MYYVGIDLGGTNIAAGVVNDNGEILKTSSRPTLKTRPIEEIMTDMVDLCKSIVHESGLTLNDIEAVGVGCPGTVDNESGIISYSNNIPMKNVPMREFLSEKLNKPINLENDANAAAFGEYIVNGHNAKSYVFITLGTGIGGGVVLNGKIYRGFNGVGAELGHMTLINNGLECTCGKKGCWEVYGSVTGLIRQTQEAMDAHPESSMNALAKQFGKVSGRVSFDCARNGDKSAQAVVDKYIEYVADGVTSIINIFEPERLVIGGGISKEGDYLLTPLKQFVEKYEYNKYRPKTQIDIAKLFNDAGIIGAALSCRNL